MGMYFPRYWVSSFTGLITLAAGVYLLHVEQTTSYDPRRPSVCV